MGIVDNAWEPVWSFVKRRPALSGAVAVGAVLATGGIALPVVVAGTAAGAALGATIGAEGRRVSGAEGSAEGSSAKQESADEIKAD